MIRASFFILMTVLFTGCFNKNSSNSDTNLNDGKIVFENPNHDFGNLVEGDVVEHAYVFTNKGNDPVEILDVQVSCGCTVASKPSRPIGVGQKGEIKIKFNTAGKVGVNNKGIGVISNGKNPQEVLKFTAIVQSKTEENND